jgi:hypothetical protein
VSQMNRNWKVRRVLRLVAVGLVAITAGMSLAACETPAEEEGGEEAAAIEPIKGTDVNRVTLTSEAAETLGIKTATIKRSGRRAVVPEAAVIYGPEGNTFTYSSPKPLTYVRRDITVDHIDGSTAVLTSGPPAGSAVVTVGSAELSGLENEYEPE